MIGKVLVLGDYWQGKISSQITVSGSTTRWT